MDSHSTSDNSDENENIDYIKRSFPVCSNVRPLQYKSEKPIIIENRLTEEDFNKYNEISIDPGYLKLCTGINPLTGKKIKIGGDTYNRVLKNYTIKNCKPFVIADIVVLDYLNETKKIIEDNIKYNKIHAYNIKQYNDLVDIVNAKYAKYNEEILGNKSVIFTFPNKDMGAFEKFKERFEVVVMEWWDYEHYLVENNFDYLYLIKMGANDGYCLTKIPTLVHAVFRFNEPHGHKYFYVSDWLAKDQGYNPYHIFVKNYQHRNIILEKKITYH